MQNFRFKKKYGQNFIKNKAIVQKIVNSSEIEDDSLIIEVGPGKGVLTEVLSEKADKVLCYEIDSELETHLISLQKKLGNVEIIFGDFLDANIVENISKYNYKHIYFISNVPYYITTPILMKIMECKINFDKIVMMVQEEVGERFSASPGKKAYSSITVYLNYYYDVKRLFKVNRSQFIPVPNVDSEVVMFSSKKDKLFLKNEKLFFELVRDSFKFKRKTIKNNLKKYNLNIIEKVLIDNGFSLSSRAEQIPVEVFVQISNAL